VTPTLSGGTHMAKKAKSKKPRLPQEFVDRIYRLKPEDLAVEAAMEEISLEISKEDIKNDSKLNSLKDQIKELDEELDGHPDVMAAEDAVEKAREENTSTEHVDLREQHKALRQALTNELREQKKRYKFMKETLRTHMRSGLLKRAT
jgi:hypothetical protein